MGSWARNEDQLFYFRAATGFRPGSVNPPGLGAQITGIFIPPGFDPDTVISYEGGAKTTWYDGRLTFKRGLFPHGLDRYPRARRRFRLVAPSLPPTQGKPALTASNWRSSRDRPSNGL